jgi:hypothetical protein
VIGEFTRQAPARRAARILLATGPVAGASWAAALIFSHAWTASPPAEARAENLPASPRIAGACA